jgi:hypothetical protein
MGQTLDVPQNHVVPFSVDNTKYRYVGQLILIWPFQKNIIHMVKGKCH